MDGLPDFCSFVGPQFLEGITIIRQLGKGAYGTVFLVKTVDGNHYAVKYLNISSRFFGDINFQSILQDTDNLVRFRRATDNVVHLTGICYQPDQIALIMEPMDYDLRRLRTMIPLSQRLEVIPKLLLSMARALSILEVLGITHFDIKPDNILVKGGTNPRFKIADFGLARPNLNNANPQKVMQYTPGYKPPESLVRVKSGVLIDHHRSDIWALAITIITFIKEHRELPHFPPYGETVVQSLMILYRLTEYPGFMDWKPFAANVSKMNISGGIRLEKIFPVYYPIINDTLGSPMMIILSKMLSLNPNDRPSAAQIVQSFDQSVDPENLRRFVPPAYTRKINEQSIRFFFQLVEKSEILLIRRAGIIIIATEILTRYLYMVEPPIDYVLSSLVIFYIAAAYTGERIDLGDIISIFRILTPQKVPAEQLKEAIRLVLVTIKFQVYNTNLTSYINSVDTVGFNVDDFLRSLPQWKI